MLELSGSALIPKARAQFVKAKVRLLRMSHLQILWPFCARSAVGTGIIPLHLGICTTEKH